ncbi:HTH-type transcriptional regulator GbpR [Pseudomonas oleovorans subsp. oleovorans]|uniref:Pca operon transcriptional activator PcaQ n=1 Tax=Ectopseudomonas oleovorans TaxID=301 RepID=A0A379JTT5_ECTOL|nr:MULTISPECIES: pca operon transcription factor PcaQ [Pseudomonadaceae]OWK49297.1 HTH-type transcriptional regulator GbpR [Pseudomonas oleovorans subsp. oleovorans]GLZ27617.1 pca operon transcription factor PcaQ [Stutzerimonas stutzeri]SUD51651.1 pca operon transcriptional activator PcaQ [Pseudomonas oleovorans]HBN9751842.1 pca operon transcription factor PcaQ [Pseudomonas aeruginosa]
MTLDNRIKLRHLTCFLEIARQGSLARAASVLAISPPAVSKTLSELEEYLGASLCERSKSGVVLTRAGQSFLRYAGVSMQALREGVRSLGNGAHEAASVRLGALSTVESAFLPEVVHRLHAQHEALQVSVIGGPSAHLLGLLRVGELDLVVGRMTESPLIEGLAFEHLYHEPLILVVRPEHPLLGAPVQAQVLEQYPVVLPQADTTIRRDAESLYVQCGASLPQQRLETLSIALSRRYVLLSDAVWVAPRDAVLLDLERGEVVELDLGFKEPGGSLGICSNPTRTPSVGTQWCIEQLREVAEEFRVRLG